MKKVQLLSLELKNFKGAKNVKIDFTNETNIYGANRTGKTTVNDAFTWLLFGKNSEDKQDFNIKTLDSKNKPIHRLEHEVKGVFDFDGSKNELRRTFQEKWTKKRGFDTPVFDGHITLYFWNDVPLNKSEFEAKVNLIISEDIVKLITNPLHFNQILKWDQRRAIITKMAGQIDNDKIFDKIATPENDFNDLIKALNEGKTVYEYKKEIAAKKKKLKDNLEGITPRIDEVKRSMPEVIDFELKEAELNELNIQLKDIEDKMLNENKALDELMKDYYAEKRKLEDLKNKLISLKNNSGSVNAETISKLSLEKNTVSNSLQLLKNNVTAKKNEIEENEKLLLKYSNRITELKAENETAKEKWHKINSSSINLDDVDVKCPTCKQDLPTDGREEKIETLKTNFNTDKSKQLAAIKAKGQANNMEVADYEKKINALNTKNESAKLFIENSVNQEQKYNSEISVKTTEIDRLNNLKEELDPEYFVVEKEIENFKLQDEPKVDTAELEKQKANLKSMIIDVQNSLNTKDQIKQAENRVLELENQEKTMAQELASLEKSEFSIEKFVSAKVSMITEKTNEMFKYVTFKMYDEQINGGLKETCEATIDGVPFPDLNTASKINAGIDIINALVKYYQISAPVFIDNRESVTTIIPCESQIINLIVSPSDTKLRVENK